MTSEATMYGDVADLLDQRPRHAVAHAWLNAVMYSRLERAAAARNEHPDRLAAEILERAMASWKET